jgi:hypothetical protein
MRFTISLLPLLGVLMIAPASAQPSASLIAQNQNASAVHKVDNRRYNGRRPYYRPHYSFGYYRPYYPPPHYAYAYPYPYPYPYYAPYYGPRAGVSLSFGF